MEGCQSARNEKLNIYSPQQNLGYLLSVYLGSCVEERGGGGGGGGG